MRTALLAAVAAGLCVTLKIGPPGSYFLVLVCGAASFLVSQGVPAGHVIGMTAVGGVVAVVVGMADLIGDPHRPERCRSHCRDTTRRSDSGSQPSSGA
mgnify:CR=1 FL=1